MENQPGPNGLTAEDRKEVCNTGTDMIHLVSQITPLNGDELKAVGGNACLDPRGMWIFMVDNVVGCKLAITLKELDTVTTGALQAGCADPMGQSLRYLCNIPSTVEVAMAGFRGSPVPKEPAVLAFIRPADPEKYQIEFEAAKVIASRMFAFLAYKTMKRMDRYDA